MTPTSFLKETCFPTLAFPRSAVQGWHACPHGLVYTGYPTQPQPLLLWPARSSGLPKSPHAVRGSQPALLDAWCRGPGMSTCDKELHKPQFFACPPHKSIIYIHNFTYFSSTYQVHLMWNNKLLDLIWRWIQNCTTPHEINKPYDFNWTKKKCLSCFCHSETCDSELSFHESEQTVPEVNAISSDFLCMNF